jgi:WD40 repeat protein
MPRVSGIDAQLRIAHTTELGSYIAALAWAPDSQTVAIGGDDGSLRTLETTAGASRELDPQPGGVITLAWSRTGTLASGGRDGRIRLDGETLDTGGRSWIERLAWRPDGGLLAAAAGRRVQFWTPERDCRDVSADFPATVTCLAWHPKGILCAAGSYGGVRLLRANGAAIDRSLTWTGSVLELCFSPDGTRLAHGNQDASVHFWDLRKTTGELEMSGYPTKVRELSWSPDGRWLATGGGETVTLWDFHRRRGPTGSRPLELDKHTDRITQLAFHPHQQLLASAARDGLVLLWHPNDDDLPITASAFDAPITTLAWAPDGERLAIGTSHGAAAILELTQ